MARVMPSWAGRRAVELLAALGLCLFELAAVGPVRADERILSFSASLRVRPDASIAVSETIAVRSEAVEIRRGIYRDLFTRHRDRGGTSRSWRYEVLDATRNGADEEFHTDGSSGRLRIYLGRRDVQIPAGEYIYVLNYLAKGGLTLGDGRDELYWNVTGNRWTFPIDDARVEVRLPGAVSRLDVRTDSYIGPQGSSNEPAACSPPESLGVVRCASPRALAVGEGLTIAVSWPSGSMEASEEASEPSTSPGLLEPTSEQSRMGLFLLLLTWLWFVIVWWQVGRDPPSESSTPVDEPPAGISPAMARYLREMKWDTQVLTASILRLATRGFIRIRGTQFGWTLQRVNASDVVPSSFSREERALAVALLPGSREVELTREGKKNVRLAIQATRSALTPEVEGRLLAMNTAWLWPGALLAAGGLVYQLKAMLSANFQGLVYFGSLVAGVWIVVRPLVGSRPGRVLNGTVLSVLAVIGLAALGVVMILQTLPDVDPLAGVLIPVLPGSVLIAYHALKARTREGRKLLDRVEAFRQYLVGRPVSQPSSTTSSLAPAALFEAYLPYAAALDVEPEWWAQFERSLGEAYRPDWFQRDESSAVNAGGGSGLYVAFGVALAAAASHAAYGSSDGDSSGGSSGGGGGGGGGGGW